MARRRNLRFVARRRAWLSLLGIIVFLAAASAPYAVHAAPRTVRVGVYQNAPKIFLDENGRATGLFIELLERIAAEEGWTLVYVPCEWAACLQALEDGEIDLMPDVAYSAERDELYDFTKHRCSKVGPGYTPLPSRRSARLPTWMANGSRYCGAPSSRPFSRS